MHKIVSHVLNNNVAIGTWCTIPSPQVASILAQGGFNFVIIDMVYGQFSWETTYNIVNAIRSQSCICTPFIKIANQDRNVILQALATGCEGVAIPDIKYHDIWTAFENQKFPQIYNKKNMGKRRYFPYAANCRYDSSQLKNFLKDANDQILPILLIEDLETIEAFIDSKEVLPVAKSPDRVYYTDLFSLAQAMGHSEHPYHPHVLNKLERFTHAVRQSGQIAGCAVSDNKSLTPILNMGVNFIAYEADSALLHSATLQAISSTLCAIHASALLH